ncbi:MAG: tetratricopeptide repeat protein [Planctomycetota bacterium]
MKNQLIDKFSKVGRLEVRLREIVARADDGEVTSMDAGDLIGRQIVAFIEAQPDADSELKNLHLDAELARGVLYQRSNGATPLEAAESLTEAHRLMKILGKDQENLDRLIEPTWKNYEDLVEIGSRRTSWSSLQVIFDVLEDSEAHRSLRPKVVEAFATLAAEFDEDCEIGGAIARVLEISKWGRDEAPEALAKLLTFMPRLLQMELAHIDTDIALQAFLYGSKNDAELEVETYEHLVRRLIDDGRRDTEVRMVYKAFLEHHPERHTKIDAALRRLAHVHPDPTFSHDPDLDGLNQLCCEVFGANAIWPWRNRALMMRRKSDLVGAVSCLAKAMNISGEPPDLIGLLAPVLYRMGFLRSAKEFARFAPAAERQRFRLRTLDLLEAVPRTDRGAEKLVGVLEMALAEPELPPEFRPGLSRRIAELQLELGNTDRALALFTQILDDDPSDEVAAVRLAEIEASRGRTGKARTLISGDLSARVTPWVKFIESLMAEFEEDLSLAHQRVCEAIASLPEAHDAGRLHCQKAFAILDKRIRDDHGEAVANGPLLSMLQTDVFGAVHEDLASLTPRLEQRRLELSLRAGDLSQAEEAITAISSRNPDHADVLINGLRLGLRAESQKDSTFFLDQLTALELEQTAEVAFLFGLHSARWGEPESALEHFERAVELEHGAPAILALATMKAETGDEAGALELIEAPRDDQHEGSETQLRRLAQIRGILLERSGRMTEARVAYQGASRLGQGWHEARRRAGLLSLQEGLAKSDAVLVRDAVSCLEGFRDPESVIAETRARAALAKTPREAASLFETAIKRVDARHRLLFERLRLPHLLEAGEFDTAEQIASDLLDDVEMEASIRQGISGVLAWLQRRRIVDSLTFIDPAKTDDIEKVADELSETSQYAEVIGLDAAVATLRLLVDPKAKKPKIDGASAPELVLAAAFAVGLSDLPSQSYDELDKLRDDLERPDLAELSRYRLAVEGAESEELAVDRAAKSAMRLGAQLPYSESSIKRLAGIRAVASGDRATLEEVLASGVEGLDDLMICLELSELCARDGGVDTTRLTRGLARLSKSTGNKAFSDALQRVQKQLATIRETPSPAWASSRLRTAGKRARVFLPAVLKFWESQADHADARPEVFHQVALLRISAAHEAEAAGCEDESVWFEAHDAWRCLIECKPYWKELKQRLGAPAVEATRDKLAKWLVFAHLKRAQFYLDAKKLAHAMRHAKYATSSPLADMAGRPELNERVFSLFASDFERLLQRKHFSEALECLDHVLLADEKNTHAEREMIRVAAEGLRQPFGMLDALRNEPDEFTLSELAQFMRSLLAYADRGVDRTERRESIDSLLAEDLAICLRGQAFLLFHDQKDAEGAAKLVDRALEILPKSSRSEKPLRDHRAKLSVAMASDVMASASNTQSGLEAYGRALSDIDSVLSESAGNRDLMREKARLLLAKGLPDEAEDLARELYENAQESKDADRVREAIELVHEVQQGRDASQLHGKLGAVEMLISERNWRTALQVFKEAAVGHESDGPFVVKHIQILLGLHKVRKVEEALPALDGFVELKDDARLLTAQLQCLKYMSSVGGDIYSAFELYERQDYKKAMNLMLGLAAADTQDLGAQFLTAVCQYHLNGEAESEEVFRRADQQARVVEAFWVCELLKVEKSR